MLDDGDKARIAAGFSVFEHDWRFYSGFLGEPVLLGDILTFFDGDMLYVCGFRLGAPDSVLTQAELRAIVSQHPHGHTARAVDVWGPVSVDAELAVGARKLPMVSRESYSAFDSIAPLKPDFFQTQASARLARNSTLNHGLRRQIVERAELDARHLAIVREWRDHHEVDPVVGAISATVPGFCRADDVFVVEVYEAELLVGFGVLHAVSPTRSVLLQCYITREHGHRVGDAVMAGAIEKSIELGVSFLHLGYSFSQGLLDFKRKWGATLEGPKFTEAFFSQTGEMAEAIRNRSFLWAQRMSHAPGK